MNNRTKQLLSTVHTDVSGKWVSTDQLEPTAEMLIQEVKKLIDALYHQLPLDQAVTLLTLDNIIDEHFYLEKS
jgi:hypothetical protein